MTEQSNYLFTHHQVRKSRKQKEAFRTWLWDTLKEAGYAPSVEKGLFSRNVVAGDPDRAEILFTAHYDTCAVLPIPNFITPRNPLIYVLYQLLFVLIFFLLTFVVSFVTFWLFDAPPLVGGIVTNVVLLFCIWWILDGKANRHTANDNTSGVLTLLETALALPEELREKVCFVFFDNEEKGLFGSSAFAKSHKEARKKALVVNFDCVSDGDHIRLFLNGALKKDAAALERLETAFQSRGRKQVEVVRGFGYYPSDQKAFRRGVGVCALRYKPVLGYYLGRIHTRRDTVLEEENIALLRDGAVRLARTRSAQYS